MPLAERRERWQAMMEILHRNDAKAWRESFLHSLARGDCARRSSRALKATPSRVLRLPACCRTGSPASL
jgi:trehalose-6-phosphate synthase